MAWSRVKEIERYEFLRLFALDFHSARRILEVLRRYRRKDVRYELLVAFVVTYVRPFVQSRGVHLPSYTYSDKVVPRSMRKLHEELLKQRNQQFAHTDHVFREPNVERWGTKENAWFALSFRRDNFEMLEQQLPEISLLVDAVTTSLHAQISEIEKTLFSEAASEK